MLYSYTTKTDIDEQTENVMSMYLHYADKQHGLHKFNHLNRIGCLLQIVRKY